MRSYRPSSATFALVRSRGVHQRHAPPTPPHQPDIAPSCHRQHPPSSRFPLLSPPCLVLQPHDLGARRRRTHAGSLTQARHASSQHSPSSVTGAASSSSSSSSSKRPALRPSRPSPPPPDGQQPASPPPPTPLPRTAPLHSLWSAPQSLQSPFSRRFPSGGRNRLRGQDPASPASAAAAAAAAAADVDPALPPSPTPHQVAKHFRRVTKPHLPLGPAPATWQRVAQLIGSLGAAVAGTYLVLWADFGESEHCFSALRRALRVEGQTPLAWLLGAPPQQQATTTAALGGGTASASAATATANSSAAAAAAAPARASTSGNGGQGGGGIVTTTEATPREWDAWERAARVELRRSYPHLAPASHSSSAPPPS